MKQTISILFLCFLSVLTLTSCNKPFIERKKPLTNYFNDFEDYHTYTIMDSDKNVYYMNDEQENIIIDALNKFLLVDVVKYEDFNEENALRHFYVCLVLSNNSFDLFFMYNASPDGDARIEIYDNKTATLYKVADNYDAELALGVTICSIFEELKKI